MNRLKIIKVLNHNVVHCFDENRNKEVMTFGKGIGFQKKQDSYVDSDYEKIYEIKEYKNALHYSELVSSIDEEITTISEEIISELIIKFGSSYHERLHVSLLDHLNFSIKRYRSNIAMTNLFLNETKFMYPKEYEFAEAMLDKVNTKLNIELPPSEIGFIAMHIHSSINNQNVGITNIVVKIISESLQIIKEELNIDLDNDNLCKERLILHLKFAIMRAINSKAITNPLLIIIKEKYADTYAIASKIANHIMEDYNIYLNESEISYLTVHIQNAIDNG